MNYYPSQQQQQQINLPLKYPQQQIQTMHNTNQQQSSSSSSSKLHRYFSSSQYLSTQQQLAVFIQGFPIINIQTQHKSLNDILPLLIKQNQLLGKKCHSQVLLIKQSFSKHQSINKQYKAIKQQMQVMRVECQGVVKEKDVQIVKMSQEIDELRDKVRICEEFVVVQNGIVRQLLAGEFRKVEEMLATRAVKDKYSNFVDMIENTNPNQLTQTILPLTTIQKHTKQHKRKAKYFSKVRQSVDEFCSRLIKITQIVPIQIVVKELKYECKEFMEIVAELIGSAEGKRRKENVGSNGNANSQKEFSQRQTISLRSHAGGMSNSSPFQLLLTTFMTQTTQHHTTQLTTLQSQLQQLHQQLTKSQQQQSTSKQYYQSHLQETKMQFEKQKHRLQQQFTIKEQMTRHYEEELEKGFAVKEELENRLGVLGKENERLRQQYGQKVREVEMLREQLHQKEQAITKLRQKHKLLQQQHTQTLLNNQQQHKQTLTTLHQRLKHQHLQHQQQLSTKHTQIKQRQQQIALLNSQVRNLKQTIQDKILQLSRMSKRLTSIQQHQLKTLQSKVQSMQKQSLQLRKSNKHLNKTIQQLHHEISLNTSYIHQLESKSQKKDQAIEKLNKKLSSVEMDKKGSNKLKQANQMLQQQLGQSSNQLSKVMEQNANLKKLVKQMKKQLQSVYHTINDLKTIQKDREKLVMENQKSQRWRQQIIKDYDQMKFEILKVEAENKSLLLELRHYKNALKRIQMIQ